MKILLIASGKAAMTWEKQYTSDEFEETYRRAADCDIEAIQVERISSHNRPVYVSSTKNAVQTAEFKNHPIH